MPAPRELFISHCATDRRFVNKLTKVLDRYRIGFWYSRSHLVGGVQWFDEIGDALARCDWFVVVLSKAALQSEWVKRELVYAQRNKRYQDHIIPLVLQNCDYEKFAWTLPAIQRVDFTLDFHEGCRQLLRIWNLDYRPLVRKRAARKK